VSRTVAIVAAAPLTFAWGDQIAQERGGAAPVPVPEVAPQAFAARRPDFVGRGFGIAKGESGGTASPGEG
jgi:hypothetical protein